VKEREMALADKTWTPVNRAEVILEWCRAERDSRLVGTILSYEMPAFDELLRSGDVGDPAANQERYRRLWNSRGPILEEIPQDTEWYDVTHLTDAELCELRVIYHCDWDDLETHRNELRRVAALKPEPLQKLPAEWERPILWGHTKSGPFTILEGNHRMIGYASQKPPPGLSISVLVGLSPRTCNYWHIVDALSYESPIVACELRDC
jgi:hypothetical protein